jgi:anaerobic magnesium-protoporphyrin IX monomethyl ester cyclase
LAKVTLINPQIAVVPWNALPTTIDATCIRLGLAYISACLKRAGHDVRLIDLRLLGGWKEYDSAIRRHEPDFLAVTMHTCEFNIAIECCRRARKSTPRTRTIVGGIHPTMFPDECLRTGVVDYVVRGEGELSLPKLVSNPDEFPPQFWGDPPDLDTLPYPDRELWDDYSRRIQFPPFTTKKDTFAPPTVEMLTGRGCPWQCRFCCGPGEQNLYSRQRGEKRVPYVRRRSVSNVLGELDALYSKYRFRSIIFHDDQFVIERGWTEEFCRQMHERGFVDRGVKWWAASRADIITRWPALFREMKGAGLKMLSVGFESFSDRILQWLNKGVSLEQNWQAVRVLRELGIDIYGNFIFGVPYSDSKYYPEDDIKTAEAIVQIRPEIASCSFLTPIPGSYFHAFCEENGLISCSPENLGSRFPGQAKIAGVDYTFLDKILPRIPPTRRSFAHLASRVIQRMGLSNVMRKPCRKFMYRFEVRSL